MSNNQELMSILKNCGENDSLRRTNTNLYLVAGVTIIAVIYLTPKVISVVKENRETKNLYKSTLSRSNYFEMLAESRGVELARIAKVVSDLEKQLIQCHNNTIGQSGKSSGISDEG